MAWNIFITKQGLLSGTGDPTWALLDLRGFLCVLCDSSSLLCPYKQAALVRIWDFSAALGEARRSIVFSCLRHFRGLCAKLTVDCEVQNPIKTCFSHWKERTTTLCRFVSIDIWILMWILIFHSRQCWCQVEGWTQTSFPTLMILWQPDVSSLPQNCSELGVWPPVRKCKYLPSLTKGSSSSWPFARLVCSTEPGVQLP